MRSLTPDERARFDKIVNESQPTRKLVPMTDIPTKAERETSALRKLCGELEDMSVLKDDVRIDLVRARLESAVAESEHTLDQLEAERNEAIALLREYDEDDWWQRVRVFLATVEQTKE